MDEPQAEEEAELISFEQSGEEISFRVNQETRTIAGTVVPWGSVAKDSRGVASWRFQKGSLHWVDTARVKLNIGHDRDRAVAYATHLQNTPAGLYGKFKVARGEDGDRALQLAEDKILDGFSIEPQFEEGGWEYDRAEPSVRNVTRARLVMVGLVPVPAFDGAYVESIAAQHVGGEVMENDPKDVHKDEDEGAAKFEVALTSLTERIDRLTEQQAIGAAQLGDAVSASLRTAFEEMATPQGPSTVKAARFGTLNEPPVYRFNGSGGPSLVQDAWKAARDRDEGSIDRLRKFRQQSEDMAAVVNGAIHFAPQTTTTAGALVPPGYRPDLYVTELTKGRPIIQTASQGTIDNAAPFTLPTFTSSTSVTADHVEGTNPSDGSMALAPRVVTPQAISGRLVLTREIVDSSNPAIDQIAFATMRESYARQTEAKAYTLLNGTSGAGGTITSGFVPSGAQAVTTAGGTDNQTLVKAIRKAIADYNFARFAPATAATMGQGATARLAQAVDTTQRPLFPWVDGDNAFGPGNALEGGYRVDSLRFIPAWANTGTAAGDSQIMLVNSADLWVWESPLLTFRFEEKQGPANIELNVFGYFAIHLLRPVGLSGIRIT